MLPLRNLLMLLPLSIILMGAAQHEKPRLTFQGLGDVRIGMTVEQVKALGFRLTADGPWSTEEERYSCHYLDSASDYPGVHLMMNEDRLVRIDIYKGDWRSLSGAKLGMTKADLRGIYGSWLKESLHPYGGPDIDEWAYLTLRSSNGKYGAVFEMSDRKIDSFRMGTDDAVGYIEGCA